MRSYALLILTAALVSQSVFAQDIENTRAKPADWEEVNFETNSAVLVDGFPSLLRLADLLKAHPDYKITIVGNTDQRGSDRANDALSLRRANAVAQFLEKYGATAGQVTVRGDGKRNLEENARNNNAMFVNRRVTINVTAPDGTVIGDGSIASAIEDFITYARAQLGKIDQLLAQIQQLEAQVRALNTADIKQDTGQIRQDTGQIRQDAGQIRQDSAQIRQDTGQIRQDATTLVQRPTPLTGDQTTQIAHDAADYALKEAATRNRKYSQVGFGAGPTFGPSRVGDFDADVFGRALIPFGNGKTPEESGTHGFLVDGSWVYGHSLARTTNSLQLYGSSDAIFNTGLVNRFGHAQVGTFVQFDYASLGLSQLLAGAAVPTNVFTRGGAFLSGGVATFQWVFPGFTAGVFGAKGIKETGNVTTTALTPVTTPAYLRYDDQAGVSFAGTFRKFQIEGSGAWVKRYARGLDEQPSGMLKVSFGPTDTLQFFIEGDVNTTFNGVNYGDRLVFGLQFGNWVRARNYGSTQSVVPVVMPRPHYELLTR